MKIIEIENLILEYVSDEEGSKVRALDGVSLEIEEGSFVSIIGKNGSGKSSLSKCLNGLLIPTSGKVKVNGFYTDDEEHILDIRQSCGMVFQNPDNQLVSSIVEDDIAFGPENLGLDPKEIQKRVDEALKSVDMFTFKDRPPHLLSGGQKQRIAIAGVLAMKPKCIVFDEPTAMLDPKGRKEIMRIIDELHKEGITVILITHFMEEAIKGDRIIVLKDGKILLDGSPKEVFSNGDAIKFADLDLPFSVELRERLINKGMNIPNEVFTSDELKDYLCQLK